MSNNILLVFEGARSETIIFKKVIELFFKNNNSTFFYSYFDAEVFQLCKKIMDDKYIDLLELLRERHQDNEIIIDKEFSEIYLFFDHDAHSHSEVSKSQYYLELKRLINTFDNETEQGKIYLSYPMIEALRDCRPLIEGEENICDCFQSITENINYKKMVHERSIFNIKEIESWYTVIGINYLRACKLIDIDISEQKEHYKLITQLELYVSQYKKHIKKRSEVLILSAIPFFIMDYFGQLLFKKINFSKINVYCKYFCG